MIQNTAICKIDQIIFYKNFIKVYNIIERKKVDIERGIFIAILSGKNTNIYLKYNISNK